MADTTYIVLRHVAATADLPSESNVFGWAVVASDVSAASARQAVSVGCGQEAGEYVAVPARSWKPVTVRTETQTVIRLDTPPAE
jgi:hypothetical protein